MTKQRNPPSSKSELNDLVKYKDKINHLIDNRDGERVENGNADHCAILLEAMFNNAKTMRILTGNLNQQVYARPQILSALADFLERNGELKIIAERALDKDHPIHKLLSNNSKNLSLNYLPEDFVDLICVHLTIMDNDSFRLEGDKNDFSAIAAFGAEDTENVYGDFFSLLESISQPEPTIH